MLAFKNLIFIILTSQRPFYPILSVKIGDFGDIKSIYTLIHVLPCLFCLIAIIDISLKLKMDRQKHISV